MSERNFYVLCGVCARGRRDHIYVVDGGESLMMNHYQLGQRYGDHDPQCAGCGSLYDHWNGYWRSSANTDHMAEAVGDGDG